jgi:hypothetical protein
VKDKVVEFKIEEPYVSSSNILYLMDRYLIISDLKTFDKYLHLFDRNTFAYITSIAGKGQGPHEIVRIGPLSVNEPLRTLYVPDDGGYKILAYHIDSIFSDSYRPELKMVMKETLFPNHIHMINDSMAICDIIQPIGTANYKPATGTLNINTGEIMLMKYEHPQITGRKRFYVAVSPEHKPYVEAYHRHDLMTICNFDGDLIQCRLLKKQL